MMLLLQRGVRHCVRNATAGRGSASGNWQESRDAKAGRPFAWCGGCMRSVALLVVVGCSYSPGSFSYPGRYFAGQRLTVGCLDVSIDRRADAFESAVLDFQFGNRCDDPVVVDLLSVPVIGRTVD